MPIGDEQAISDTAWIAGIIILFTILSLLFKDFEYLRNGVITGLVGVISILTYRFSVKSNIRTIIGDLRPIESPEYQIYPVVNSVKWRPEFLSSRWGQKRIRGRTPLQRSVTVDIRAYEKSGESTLLSDWKSVMENEDFEDEFLDQLQNHLNDEFAPKINAVRHGPFGMHISIFSTNGRLIGLIASTALKEIGSQFGAKS